MNVEERTLSALKRVMRPLVRLLIARGIQLPRVVAALKQVYVDVAETDFRLEDKSPTDSRISVLTGLYRRDVGNIRREGTPTSTPSPMSLSATVIGRWFGDPAYQDKQGQAKILYRSADQGSPSFQELAYGCSKDVHPRTILDDLIDQKLVEWDEEEDIITLTKRAFVPDSNSEEMMRFFEMNLHDHVAAAVHNVSDDKSNKAFLERAVYYNKLTPEAVQQLESIARDRSDELLHEMNGEALQRQDQVRQHDQADRRFRFGVFFYCEDEKKHDRQH
ncbi:MAG: DUF6502 family protein [Pseudomonadota bacterium]